MSKKVCFAGAYGIRSQGDDAALVVMYDQLRRRFPALTGVVACRHADEDLYAPYGLRSLPNFEYGTKAESTGRWFRGFNFEDERTDLCHLEHEISGSDLLVLGAGNAFIDYTIDLLRGPIPYFFVLTLMARMNGTPLMWFGISVGPLCTDYGRKLTRLAAELADVITVRDERSIQALRSLGFGGEATLLPDPVLGLEPVGRTGQGPHPLVVPTQTGNGPVVAVSLRSIPDSPELTFNDYLDTMAAVCDRLALVKGATLLFVPQCTYSHGNVLEDDRRVAAEVVRRMRVPEAALVVENHLSIKEAQALYASSTVALCTRLHGNVCAAIEGVPTVAISYNPKVASFMAWLGCPELVVMLEDFSFEAIMLKLGRVLANRDQLSAHVKQRAAEGRRQIEQYALLAAKALQSAGTKTQTDGDPL